SRFRETDLHQAKLRVGIGAFACEAAHARRSEAHAAARTAHLHRIESSAAHSRTSAATASSSGRAHAHSRSAAGPHAWSAALRAHAHRGCVDFGEALVVRAVWQRVLHDIE